jgi:hypothetical protein
MRGLGFMQRKLTPDPYSAGAGATADDARDRISWLQDTRLEKSLYQVLLLVCLMDRGGTCAGAATPTAKSRVDQRTAGKGGLYHPQCQNL